MSTLVGWLLVALAGISLITLALHVIFVPISLYHEVADRRRRARNDDGPLARTPSVSVVVPAFNEEAVLSSCVNSILQSGYTDLEVIIVDDGSTDSTADLGRDLAASDERVSYVYQTNAGKGAALNNGYAHSTGEFIMFVDADSVFTPATVPEMLRAFRADNVGAVCGDDRPINLDSVLTRFLALITHVGTGLVRRAFDILRCVPVISGNCGTFRRTALDDIATTSGPFREDTIGEDLELTWRLHQSPWRVVFAPRALVYAESPSNLRALWKQRVRWARGLLQGFRHHWQAMFQPRFPVFTAYLWFTVLVMIVMPLAQIAFALWAIGYGAVTAMTAATMPEINGDLWGWFVGSGLALSLLLLVIAMAMSNALRDLRHVWTFPLWPIYSFFISFNIARALWLELANRPNVWNKPNRTGTISAGATTTLSNPTSAAQPAELS